MSEPKHVDDTYWFLKPQEEIAKMRDSLPVVYTTATEEFLCMLVIARARNLDKEFIDAFFGYIQVKEPDLLESMKTAAEDWDLIR